MCYILIFTQHLAAQDFLQIKYSINDITKQRETIKNEKIKSVSIKDNYSEKVFEIDIEGKVISETGTGDNSYSIIFNYDLNNNLTNFIGPFAHQIFEYDNQGNVIKSFDEGYSNEYFYDNDNLLVKMTSESPEGEISGIDKIIYAGNLVTETISSCEEGFIERKVYEYSNTGQLLRILTFSKHCFPEPEDLRETEEYYYKDNYNLPFKMTKGQYEINFTYEYYE